MYVGGRMDENGKTLAENTFVLMSMPLVEVGRGNKNEDNAIIHL